MSFIERYENKQEIFFGLDLNEEQKEMVTEIMDGNSIVVMCNAVAGAGKACPNNTLIPAPNGYKKIGDLKIGDFVFDRKGQPTKVIGVFPQGQKEVFELTFSDGSKALCNDEHLWTVYETGKKSTATKTVKELLQKTITIPESGGHRYAIPVNSAVEYSHKDFPVDPYVIGAFIGNGCCTERGLTISSADEFVVQKIQKRINASYYRKCHENNYSWIFYKGEKKRYKTKEFFTGIKGVIERSGQKYIPEEYKFGDKEQRLQLINGLFDTDGSISYCNGRYNVTYSTTSRKLIYDVKEVLNSLGYRSRITKDNRTKYKSGECFILYVCIPNDEKVLLFSLPRKKEIAEKAAKEPKRRLYDRLHIYDIKPLNRTEEMTCIYVDNPEHLFLMNDYIVTHNTLLAVACAKILALSPEYDFDGATYIFPTVEEGVLGYKPGSIEDKERSYLSPLYDALEAVGDFPPKSIKSDENKSGQAWIRAQSGTFMRGSNIEKKVLIIDEAQNMTIPQLKKIISRAHDNCKVIILGCTEQIDIDPRHSGFSSLLRFLGQYKDKVKVCELKKSYRGWLAQTINNF